MEELDTSPAAVKAARIASGLTQEGAAKVIYAATRAWQSWEADSVSSRKIEKAKLELFLLKTGQIKLE